jgi:hypothetical protein
MLSYPDLAKRAGVDPWRLRDDLSVGNPAEITGLARMFARAAGDAELTVSLTREAAELTAHGYTVDRTPVIDPEAHVAATQRLLGNGGDSMRRIARILDSISDDLEVRIPAARSEVGTLEGELRGIDARWVAFMRDIGHHLPPDDRQAVRAEFENDAVAAVRLHGGVVRAWVNAYEQSLSGYLKTLADLGYIPPGELDYGPGDPRPSPADILDRYQVDPDPDGTVLYPPPPLGWFTEQRVITKTEARMLDDLGLFGQSDFKDLKDSAYAQASQRFPSDGQEDGHGDAFRHAYWNALMVRKYGPDWARQFATAHERLPGNPADREAMDLFNNEVGRRIASEHPDADPEELATLVEQAVRRGDTVVVDANGDLRYSSDVEPGRTGEADDPPRDDGGGGNADSSAGSTTSGTASGGSVTGSAGS